MARKNETTDGGIVAEAITNTTYKPMSVAAPTLEEEIEALKLRISILEHNCKVSHGARQPYVPRTVS